MARDEEVEVLTGFLTGDGPSAQVVRGDAGVGKTALAAEVARRAAVAGWRVVRATGVEAETSFALGGLNQIVCALRSDMEDLDGVEHDVLAAVLAADAVAVAAPMTLAMALLTLLIRAARRRPLLVLVEDLHWFDDVSAAVLGAAGRRLTDPRVHILTTARPQHSASSTDGWSQVDLQPFDADAAVRVLDQAAPGIDAATRQRILDLAAGNALALKELPRNAEQIDTTTSALPLTDRLVTVFGARLRRLDERVRTELLRAALDGTPTSTSADTGARYRMVDVDAAIEQGLLSTDASGEPVFRHPMVRAAVIHQASATQRRHAHAHLAALYDDVLMRRATHLSAAATGPDQAVADLLDRAARASIRRGGAATAVDWLRRAAELSTDASRRVALRADAAFVASQANRFSDARNLTNGALADVDDGSPAAILTGAYLALYGDGDPVTGHRRLITALDDAESHDDVIVNRLAAVLLAVTLYAGSPQAWQQTDATIERLAPRLDAAIEVCRDAWGDITRRGHTVSRRLDELLNRSGEREPWDVMRLGVAAYYVDDLATHRRLLTGVFDRESDRGAVTNAMTILHLLFLDQFASGDWRRAAESIRLGSSMIETHPNALFGQQFIAYRGLLAAATGDVETAQRCADEVTAWAAPRHLGHLLAIARRTTTLLALGAGDFDTAFRSVTRGHVNGEIPPYSKQLTEELLDLVEAAIYAGHPHLARTYVEKSAQFRVGDISPKLAALTAAVTAMTCTEEEAGDLYEHALAQPNLQEFPLEHNRIRLSYGMWLRRQRRTTDARSHLGYATEGFRILGARQWERRASTELRASGATVKRSTDAVALSAQERTIADLAATGHTNKEIAAQLYLSPRTVGAHLYRIFPKLGITSRAALRQALNDLDSE